MRRSRNARRDGKRRKALYGFAERKMRPYLPSICLLFLFSLVIKYLDTLEPLFSGRILDELASKRFDSFIRSLTTLFLILTVALALSSIVSFLRLRLSRRISKDMEGDLYETLISNKIVDSDGTGNQVNIFLNDIGTMSFIFTGNVPDFLLRIFTLTLISYRLFAIHSAVFFLSITAAVPSMILSLYFGKKGKILKEAERKANDRYLGWITKSLQSTYDIQNSTAKRTMKEQFLSRIEDTYSILFRSLKLSTASNVSITLLNVLATFGLYVYVGYCIYRGTVTIGSYVVVIMYSQQLRAILNSFGAFFQNLMASEVSVERVIALYESKNPLDTVIHHETDLRPSIAIDEFSYSYQDNRKVFDCFSYMFGTHGLYLIKGENGCGKTTLLNAISGYSPPGSFASGSILVKTRNQEKGLYYVSQRPPIIPVTVSEYLAMNSDCLADEEIASTCRITGVIDFIEDTEKGFDAILGEDATFSQGQAQRLALTKALLSGYDIILLDEIESSLDKMQRNAIKGILSTVSESRLVILVTHSDLYDEIAKDILYLPPVQHSMVESSSVNPTSCKQE